MSGTDGATVTSTTPGTCVIDANQAAGNGYAAPQVHADHPDQAPAFVTDSPPLATAPGQAYAYTFAATGIPAPVYALAAGAPAWLTINAATGQVTGTPPAVTTSFTYAVTATNTVGTATAGPYTVTVTRAAAHADISAALACPAALPAGTAGTCTLTAANGGPAPPPGSPPRSCSRPGSPRRPAPPTAPGTATRSPGPCPPWPPAPPPSSPSPSWRPGRAAPGCTASPNRGPRPPPAEQHHRPDDHHHPPPPPAATAVAAASGRWRTGTTGWRLAPQPCGTWSSAGPRTWRVVPRRSGSRRCAGQTGMARPGRCRCRSLSLSGLAS